MLSNLFYDGLVLNYIEYFVGGDILNTEMLKGTIDLLILSVLKEKENYGYEISKAIKSKTQGEFEIQEATLYLALKRLEQHDAVSSFWGNETHGGKRKYYSITEEGKLVLNRSIQDWVNTTKIVNRFIQEESEDSVSYEQNM